MENEDYLVVDLEATCDNGGLVPRREMEIIEIGAVLVDGKTMEATREFQTFVRPVRHPRLTPFCTELTSITQDDVADAPGFVDAIAGLTDFIGSDAPLFSSWGNYDDGQFKQDAQFHGAPLPFGGRHFNIKAAFSEHLNTRKRFGMSAALKRLGLPLHGTHHRGIDDARNIARILPYVVRTAPRPRLHETSNH